jgi:UDP-glucose 4-epimerase
LAQESSILITGGAGFIGSNVVEHLLANGYQNLTVIDDESLGRLKRVDRPGVTCVKGDILDEALMASLLAGADAVIHLAADTRVIDSIENPAYNFEVNVVGSFRLLSLARDAGCQRIINASTGGAILGDAPPPVSEELPARPLAPYGAAKLAVEGYCSAFAGAYGMKTLSLRFSNIYGPLSFHKGSVVAAFYKSLLNGRPLTVYGDGEQVRDFLYVGDLVAGVRRAIETDATGVLQLGSSVGTSINTLIALMAEATGGREIPVDYVPARQGETRITWCCIDRAREVLGFEPGTRLAEGLANTWNWFSENVAVFK